MIEFRKDINGLRAFSVILVVLFHLGIRSFRGGYVGVDIFFVISGYLMTLIIFREISQNKFKLTKFYFKRFKRIFPVLLFICTISLVVGYYRLPPVYYNLLKSKILPTLLFYSNFDYMDMPTGYFANESSLYWFLHTWSLAVEWQFYIIYPIILVILKQFMSIKRFKFTVLLMCLSSFIFSLYMSGRYPHFSFYMLPVRAWEMLLGGLVYLFPVKKAETLKVKHKSIIFYLCIFIILYCTTQFRKWTVWPGTAALMPTVAAAVIIIIKHDTKLFSNRAIQLIGTISYSVYLWHWVLFVGVYYYLKPFEYRNGLIAVILTMVVSYLSYKFIERPFLKAGMKKIVISLIIILPVLLVFNNRKIVLPSEIDMIQNFLSRNFERVFRCDLPATGISMANYHEYDCLKLDPNKKNILYIGDSLSNYLFDKFVAEYPEVNFVGITKPGHVPHLSKSDTHRFIYEEYLPAHKGQIDAVVLISTWGDDIYRIEDDIIRTFDIISQNVSKAYVYSTGPFFKRDYPYINFMIYKKFISDGDIEAYIRDYIDRNHHVISKSTSKYDNFILIPTRELFRNGDVYDYMYGEVPIFFDEEHYTKEGTDWLFMKTNEYLKDNNLPYVVE